MLRLLRPGAADKCSRVWCKSTSYSDLTAHVYVSCLIEHNTQLQLVAYEYDGWLFAPYWWRSCSCRVCCTRRRFCECGSPFSASAFRCVHVIIPERQHRGRQKQNSSNINVHLIRRWRIYYPGSRRLSEVLIILQNFWKFYTCEFQTKVGFNVAFRIYQDNFMPKNDNSILVMKTNTIYNSYNVEDYSKRLPWVTFHSP